MKTRLVLFTSALVFIATLSPAETAPNPAASKAGELPPYELKHRSSFEAPAGKERAPFWPIGWVKRKADARTAQDSTATAPKAPAMDEKNFKVTSILVGSGTTPSLAVINGRAYSEGEFLRMPKGAMPTARAASAMAGSTAAATATPLPPARVQVQRISDGTVMLQYADQIMVACLQRPELGARKSEELLLDSDR